MITLLLGECATDVICAVLHFGDCVRAVVERYINIKDTPKFASEFLKILKELFAKSSLSRARDRVSHINNAPLNPNLQYDLKFSEII